MSSRDAAVLSTDDRRGCWFGVTVGPEIGHHSPKPSRSDSRAGPQPSKGPLIIFVFQERPERTHGGHQNHGCRYDNTPLEPSINGVRRGRSVAVSLNGSGKYSLSKVP